MPKNPNKVSKKKKAKSRFLTGVSKLVVVGNGMVGAKFCQELVRLGLVVQLDVTVIGDEPVVAYNRIKLGDFVEHRDIDTLILEREEWYAEHGIQLHLGQRVTKLNRGEKAVELEGGTEVEYDLLVIATGSRPAIPALDGVNHSKVLTYRNLADLKSIIDCFKEAKDVAILGGGLLGIEAAYTVQKIGVIPTVIQRANFLMTRQLNKDAGKELQAQLVEKGIRIETKAQQTSISEGAKGRLHLDLGEGREVIADYVVISAGIIPNTDFAKDAGIECTLQGGCIVDGQMRTNDDSIFAIGECASVGGVVYGLAAPGMNMAVHLAELLAGSKKHKLGELDTSTRLKTSGVDVSVIGASLEQGNQHVYQSDGVYRMITVDSKRRIIGAMGIGSWEEYAEVHNTHIKHEKLLNKQLKSFVESGKLFPDMDMVNPVGWEDSRLICNCMSVKKGEIMAAVAKHNGDESLVARETKASTVCGSCDYLVKGLCGNTTVPMVKPKVPKGLLVTSIVALIVVVAALALPPMGMAESVTSFRAKLDQLWRDNLIKQISGYTLLGVFTIGLLVSARKRIGWFNLGKYASWRYFHVAFGVVSLIILFAHTGFHFGHNLNLWLMLVFTLLNLFGAISGAIIAFENTSNIAVAKFSQAVRPYMLWGHIILFWPLPILVGFHILSVYKY